MAIADKYGIPVVEDAAEGMGSRFNGKVLGIFGKYGVLSFNGNKMITTSGGGALICRNAEDAHIAHHRHVQALYEELLAGAPVYTNGVEEELFKVGLCLPAGPYVTDEDVRYIVDSIKEAIV